MIQQQKDILVDISFAIEELTDTFNNISSQGREEELSIAIKNLAKAFKIAAETKTEGETKVEQEETE